MKKNELIFVLALACLLVFTNCVNKSKNNEQSRSNVQPVSTTKPGVLWWWFADRIKKEDVKAQLDWLKEKNIGRVMIYYLYPQNRMQKDTVHYAPRYEFLGKEFSDITIYAKKYCDSIGLGCNFLFGTGWPYGGTFINKDDATLTCTKKGLEPMRTFSVSWEWPKKGYVVDHLNSGAVDKYFEKVSKAFIPALSGNKSYLECDSWEIAEFDPIWTKGFDKMFKDRYGYDITPYVSQFYDTDKKDSLLYKQYPNTAKIYDKHDKSLADVRYDYFKLVSDLIIKNFYSHFTKRCDEIGGASVIECNGSPADVIDAYSSVDMPMTEAMLFEPNYSKIPASAAALAGKPILTSETFTCAYGWKDKYGYKEQIADMKLVADAVFANGVNQIYWHGYPLNPRGIDTVRYYATINVSTKSKLMKGFKEFNTYMEKVSDFMQKGVTLTDVAVYLPMEDRWCEGLYEQDFLKKLQPEERFWNYNNYQMRYEYFPKELNGYPMLWINGTYLKNANYENGLLQAGNSTFRSLYINVNFLPYETLGAIVELAKRGLPVCLIHDTKEPGRNKNKNYSLKLAELKALKNVSSDFNKIYHSKALIEGRDLPDYWIKKDGDDIYIFFANPKTKELKYPVKYGQSLQKDDIKRSITININNKRIPVELLFKPYQSLLLKIDKDSNVNFEDITFIPETPDNKLGIKN